MTLFTFLSSHSQILFILKLAITSHDLSAHLPGINQLLNTALQKPFVIVSFTRTITSYSIIHLMAFLQHQHLNSR